MNTTIKKAFLLVFLIAVCGNATDEWKFDYETGAGNFTAGQRWKTGLLNIVPGLGSMVIMDDFWGAVPQWALSGASIIPVVLAAINKQEWSRKRDEYFDCINMNWNDRAKCGDFPSQVPEEYFIVAGGALLGSSFIYNIYRSITYDKPKQTAFSENSGFNLAVLPNRNGKLNAFLMYNKAF